MAKQIKAIDTYTINIIGVPSIVLIERVAMWMARAVEEAAGRTDVIWAVRDTGSNEADGVATTRTLHLKGYKISLFVVGDLDRGIAKSLAQSAIARNLGMQMRPWQEATGEDCIVLIDVVFGAGLSRLIEGEYRQCMEMLETRYTAHTVTVDTPSGIHGNTGQVIGIALKTDVAVTFRREKMGIVLYPDRAYTGAIRVCDIGFPESVLDAMKDREEGYRYGLTYESSGLCLVPSHPAYSNRGTFGEVLTATGSGNMCSTAYLGALTAYRTGTGLMKLLTVEENRQIFQERLSEAIITTYTSDQLIQEREEFKKMIGEQVDWTDVVMLGPRLGSEPYVEYLAEDIPTSILVPVIIDANDLNAAAGHPYLITYFTENIIITPYLGEMARLIGESIDTVKGDFTGAALGYAGRYGITCVLKDATTVMVGKGGTLYVSSSGSSAMVKAGSSDTLTEIIVELAAIGVEEEQAVPMEVYLHGRAGEQVAGKIEQHGLLAPDLADCIRAAMKSAAHG